MIGEPANFETEDGKRWRAGFLLLVSFVLLGGFAYVFPINPGGPAVAGLDSSKVKLGLGIFACIAFLWLTEALPLAITALLVPVLATCFGLMDVKGALAGFADPLIFLFLGGFALAAALASQGLDRWLASRILALGKGDFLRVSYLMIGATAALSMWVSNTATAAMMTPLALGILRRMPSGPAESRNAIFLILGVAYAASVGGIGTVVGSPPNGIAAAKLGLDFIEWLKFGLPSVLILVPLMTLVLKWACRPVAVKVPPFEEEKFEFTRSRILTLVIFLCTAACWIGSEPLAKFLGVKDGSFDTLIVLFAVLAMAATGVVRWKQIERGTEWGVLLLFGGGITLSTLIGQTGASVFMARSFSSMVTGWPAPMVIGALIFFMIFLTELTSNTALTALMVPIFYAASGELGIAPEKLIIPLTIAASCGFMMPVGTPPNAIAFGTGRVPQRQMLGVGLILNLTFVVALTFLARFLY